jgi:hypothetical protein
VSTYCFSKEAVLQSESKSRWLMVLLKRKQGEEGRFREGVVGGVWAPCVRGFIYLIPEREERLLLYLVILLSSWST